MIKEFMQTTIREFKEKLIEKFGQEIELCLFGSTVRGDYGVYSDIDILVLLPFEPNNTTEEEIFDFGYEVELKYNIVLGIIVYSKAFWNSEKANSMPLHKNINKEGIAV